MKFIFFILVIIGISLLTYYDTWGVLTLTGGWAWLGLGCIIYFVGDMLEKIGDWLTKRNNDK